MSATCGLCGETIGTDMTHGLKNCVNSLHERLTILGDFLDNPKEGRETLAELVNGVVESSLENALEDSDQVGISEKRCKEIVDEALDDRDSYADVEEVLRNPTKRLKDLLRSLIGEELEAQIEKLKGRVHDLELAVSGEAKPD